MTLAESRKPWEEFGLDEELAKESALIRIRLEKRRYQKPVTVLDGFDPATDLEALGRELKRAIGVGGTVKDGTIELQGDQARAARKLLEQRGYKIA